MSQAVLVVLVEPAARERPCNVSNLAQALALDDAFSCDCINVHAHHRVALAEIPKKSANAKALARTLDNAVQLGFCT